jgi:small conductance mechanosensitive channel
VQIGGQSGTVEQIDMTYTRLVTPDNKQVSIPNSAVVSAQVVNYTVLGTRRVEIGIRVAWEEDADIVTDALLRASRTEKVLPDPPPSVVILSFGEGTVEYSLRLWVRSGDYWDVFFDVDRRVQQIFRERHIRIPYPRIQVRMEE